MSVPSGGQVRARGHKQRGPPAVWRAAQLGRRSRERSGGEVHVFAMLGASREVTPDRGPRPARVQPFGCIGMRFGDADGSSNGVFEQMIEYDGFMHLAFLRSCRAELARVGQVNNVLM